MILSAVQGATCKPGTQTRKYNSNLTRLVPLLPLHQAKVTKTGMKVRSRAENPINTQCFYSLQTSEKAILTLLPWPDG